jgi:uncharacterized protein (TIGR03086 family)
MINTLAEAHARAADNTRLIVDALTPDQLHNATPCDDWDVAYLVHHVVYGNLGVAPLVGGETIDEVGDRFEGDIVGDNISAAYRVSAALAVAAFNTPGAMDTACPVSYGPVPGSVYCGHRFIDLLVHGWDLAVGTAGNVDLPPDLVEDCNEVVMPQLKFLGGTGAFGTIADPGAHASPQSRLLALFGRSG